MGLSGAWAFARRAAGLIMQKARDRASLEVSFAMRRMTVFVLGLAALLANAPARADEFAQGASAYASQSYRHSAAIWARLAARGNGRAQTYLGYMYYTGRGVPQDYVAAARWMKRAANQGVPTAQYLLGLMYDKGLGVEQDFIRAEGWLDIAVGAANASERESWVLIRDAVAGKMTHDQLATAQRLAYEWRPLAWRERD